MLKKKITRNIRDELVVPVTLAVATVLNPYFGIGATGAIGIGKVLDKWKAQRVSEAEKGIGTQTILDLINRSDKDRDILHSALVNIVNESSEKKRKLYYEYLKQQDRNVHPKFDYHTKITFLIHNITFEELDVLQTFIKNYDLILHKAGEKQSPKAPIQFDKDRGVNISEVMYSNVFKGIDGKKLDRLLIKLGNYDLIGVNFGAFDGTYFESLTEFGEIFLDFINYKH